MTQPSPPSLQSAMEVLRVSLLKQDDELKQLQGTVSRQRTDVVRLLQQRQKADEATKTVSIALRKLSDDHAEYSQQLERDLEVARQELAAEKDKALERGMTSMMLHSGSMKRMQSNASRRSMNRRSAGEEGSVRRQVSNRSTSQRSTASGAGSPTSPNLPRRRGQKSQSQGPVGEISLTIPDHHGETSGSKETSPSRENGVESEGSQKASRPSSPPVDDELVGEIQEVESEGLDDETTFDDEFDEEEEEVVPAAYALELEEKIDELTRENQVKEDMIQAFAEEKERYRQAEDRWKASQEEASLHQKLIFQEVEQKFSSKMKEAARVANDTQRELESRVSQLQKDLRALTQENGVLQHRVRLTEEKAAATSRKSDLPQFSEPLQVVSVGTSTSMASHLSADNDDGVLPSEMWFKEVGCQSETTEAEVVFMNTVNSAEPTTQGGDDQMMRRHFEVEAMRSLVVQMEGELEATRRQLAEEAREKMQLQWRVDRRDQQYTESQGEIASLKKRLDSKTLAQNVDNSVAQMRLQSQLEESQQSLAMMKAERDSVASEVQLSAAELKGVRVTLSGKEAKITSLEQQLEESKAKRDKLKQENLKVSERAELAEFHEASYKSKLNEEAKETDRLRSRLTTLETDRDESEGKLRAEIVDLGSKLRDRKETAIATNYKQQRNVVSFLALEGVQDERDRLRRSLRDTHTVLRNLMEGIGLESALMSKLNTNTNNKGVEEDVATPSEVNRRTSAASFSTPSKSGASVSGASPLPRQPSTVGQTSRTSASPSYSARKSADPTSTPVDGDLLLKDVKTLHAFISRQENNKIA